MLKPILAGLFGAALLNSGALAQCATVIPNNLANGTTADATKVMANFDWLTNCVGGIEFDGRSGHRSMGAAGRPISADGCRQPGIFDADAQGREHGSRPSPL